MLHCECGLKSAYIVQKELKHANPLEIDCCVFISIELDGYKGPLWPANDPQPF